MGFNSANLSMGGIHVPDAPPVDEEQRRRARKVLAAEAVSADELRRLMSMLGLLDEEER